MEEFINIIKEVKEATIQNTQQTYKRIGEAITEPLGVIHRGGPMSKSPH